jgi:hypothetical protein
MPRLSPPNTASATPATVAYASGDPSGLGQGLRHEPRHGGSFTDASAAGIERRPLPLNGEAGPEAVSGTRSSSPSRARPRREAGRGWCTT